MVFYVYHLRYYVKCYVTFNNVAHNHLELQGVDSSNHAWTNVCVRRGNIWGISVHNVHKGEILLYSSVNIQKGCLEVDVQKGP